MYHHRSLIQSCSIDRSTVPIAGETGQGGHLQAAHSTGLLAGKTSETDGENGHSCGLGPDTAWPEYGANGAARGGRGGVAQ